MSDALFALGRGLVKLLISLLVGGGAGMMTYGIAARNKPDLWENDRAPAELFLAMGVGAVVAGVVLAMLYLFARRRPPGPTA